MEPLRTQGHHEDPEVVRTARIVASARLPAESPDAKARVRRAVAKRLDAPAHVRVWRPSYVAVALLLLSGAAAASVTWAVVRWVQAEPNASQPEGASRVAPLEEEEADRAPAMGRAPMPLTPAAPLVGGLHVAPEVTAPDLSGLLVPSPAPRAMLPAMPRAPTTRRRAVIIARAPRTHEAPQTRQSAQDVENEDSTQNAQNAQNAQAPATTHEPVQPEARELAREGYQKTDAPDNAQEEIRLLHAAYRALRVTAQPARALTLLRGQLRAHPDSALREEALGLAIEACAALGDPEAAVYGLSYIRDYPSGRFRGVAERALRRFAP